MRQISMLLITAIVVLTSCKKDETNNQTGVFNGAEVTMFGGKAKTWTKLVNGVPQQLAISINDASMNSLPTDGVEFETALDLPAQSSFAPFNHVAVDWNPHGHEPDGIYNVPHFDFHFYMISKEEQMSIPLYEKDSVKFKNYPAAEYMPANYVPIPGGVPAMGTHWVDVTSSELKGQSFTQTFLYGSYNGKVSFYEPMITLAFLKNNPTFQRAIPQPASVMQTGYYPTKLEVQKHDGVTDIILEEFVYRTKK